MSFANLTKKKFRAFIHTAVREELQEMLEDPDFGLPICPSVAQRLVRSQRALQAGRTRSLAEVVERLKLKV